MILTVTPNPCVDKTVFLDHIELGEKLRSQRYTCVPGGKGNNVSRAVKALGHATAAFDIVGGPPGQHVVDMIERQDGVRCIAVWVEGMTRTITTVLEESIHRQTALFEPGPQVGETELAAILDTFRTAVVEAKVVTFNGAVPNSVLDPLYREMVKIAKEAGAITVLDSYGEAFRLALDASPDMVKPNAEEAEALLGFSLEPDTAKWRAIDAFHDHGVRVVVLSLGAEGALVSADGQRLRATPPAIEEVNPVGSGDALVAGFAIGLQEGWPLEDMVRLGIAAGTANALSWDIGHFSRKDVETLSAQVRLATVAAGK